MDVCAIILARKPMRGKNNIPVLILRYIFLSNDSILMILIDQIPKIYFIKAKI